MMKHIKQTLKKWKRKVVKFTGEWGEWTPEMQLKEDLGYEVK